MKRLPYNAGPYQVWVNHCQQFHNPVLVLTLNPIALELVDISSMNNNIISCSGSNSNGNVVVVFIFIVMNKCTVSFRTQYNLIQIAVSPRQRGFYMRACCRPLLGASPCTGRFRRRTNKWSMKNGFVSFAVAVSYQVCRLH